MTTTATSVSPAAARPADASESAAAGDLTRPQKVAAVLLALGADSAERVLAKLPEADVEQIAQEIVALGELAPEQLLSVLDELHTEARAHRYIVTGGEHYARELLRSWRGSEGDVIVDRLLAAAEQAPFNFLNLVSPDDIARVLRDEHPQVAAVVLAHVSTTLAARVLALLPDEPRAQVAMRIATRQACSAEAIARIEDSLRVRLADQDQPVAESPQPAGLRVLASMLNSTDGELGDAVLTAIEQLDPELAAEIRSQMFVFADLASLGDRDLQEVLRTIEASQLALAMKGLEGGLRDTITRNLSERARQTLAEELDLLGPARKPDIEQARSEIAAQVRQLVEDGTVTVLRDDGGDVVA